MKKLIHINIAATLLLLGLVAGVHKLFAASATDFVCTTAGRFPVPDDCNHYYLCISVPFGFHLQFMSCPNALHFNPITKECDANYDCGNGSGTCCSYAWTGDSVSSVCWVSKEKALDHYNWWHTPDKAWCCDSCRGLEWVSLECGYR